MKKLIISSLLSLCACASASGALGGPAAADSIAGPWRGVLVKGEARSVADFRFEVGKEGYRGSYWGRALMPLALTNLTVGKTVHFEISNLGVFDGTLGDETIEGTFRDEMGEGSFKLVKELDWDDPRNVFSAVEQSPELDGLHPR